MKTILDPKETLQKLKKNNQISETQFQKEISLLEEVGQKNKTLVVPFDSSEIFATGGRKANVSQSLPEIKIGSFLLRRYELQEKIGQGGMGTVFKVWDHLLEKHYACKIIHSDLASQAVTKKKFLNELKMTEMLHHPGIVRTHALLEDEKYDVLFILMDWSQGETLQKQMQENKLQNNRNPFPFETTVEILRQLADVIQYVHSLGILHLDIKPSNILWTSKRQIKLLDFGIAQMTDNFFRGTETSLGSPYYMAPEQLQSKELLSFQADFFSFGVVAYELFTGELPIGNVAPLSKRNNSFPAQADEWFMQLLSPIPSERPKDLDFFFSLLAVEPSHSFLPKSSTFTGKKENKSNLLPSEPNILESLKEAKHHSNKQIENLRLSAMDWRQTRWENVRFENVQFQKMHLSHSVFEKCAFVNCSFMHSDLSDASFSGCSFAQNRWEQNDATRIQFLDAKFSDTSFLSNYWSHSFLKNSEYMDCKWEQDSFLYARWEHTLCKKSHWKDCEMSQWSVGQSKWESFSFLRCNLSQSIFSSDMLEQGTFFQTDLTESLFEKSELKTIQFKKSSTVLLRFQNNKCQSVKGLGWKIRWLGRK